MGAIASLSDLVNRMTGGNSGTPENIFFLKNFTIAGTADTWVLNTWYSAWKYDGFPGGGANPGAVAVPTKATAGAVPFTNPSGGRTKWMAQAGVFPGTQSDIAAVMLYDRLLHIGGLDGTNTGAQNVQNASGVSLTRNTGGVGNQIWVEIYAGIGTSARTISASYTNQAGTAGRTTASATFGGTAATTYNDPNAMIPLFLQAGDTGVQSVETVTIAGGTTGTAGNFGVTIVRPLALLGPHGRMGAGKDFTVGPSGVPSIDTDACLAFMFFAATATEVVFTGMLATVEA